MQEIIKDIKLVNQNKIVLCVLDGLGGLPINGETELEAAKTPNLNELSINSSCGLHIPISQGITPGSGAAHLSLFGYDPIRNKIGRGVLEALGLGIELTDNDLAIRGNFASVEYKDGIPIVRDRRAGRISTDENKRIVSKINKNLDNIEGVKVNLTSGMEHRFSLVLSFPDPIPGGGDSILDTDPQLEGEKPLTPTATSEDAKPYAEYVAKFINQVSKIIEDEVKANYILLRGFAKQPNLPGYKEIYGLNAACIATYPMYRGVSKLAGMSVLDVFDTSIGAEINTLKHNFMNYDFFYIHIKNTDSYGEDGNFSGKVSVIEEFDRYVPDIIDLNPSVFVVTGDHSTPSLMKSHSWHPVPFLLYSKYNRSGLHNEFNECECRKGDLGIFKATDAMALMLAHSLRLQKYGA